MRWLQILRISVFIILICAASTSGSAQEAPNWRYAPTIFSWTASPNDLKSSLSAPEYRPLVTDRPTFTPATSTVGLGRVQLETGYTYFSDDSSGTRVRQHSFPEALLRIGVVADWLELRLTQNVVSQQTVTAGIHSTTTGTQDLLVGVKLALSKNDSWLPETALIARLRVPSGSDVYTGNRVLPGLQYAYSWQTTDRLSVAGSTQLQWTRDDVAHVYPELAQSLVVSHKTTEQLTSFAEAFAFFPTSALGPQTKPKYFANMGLLYPLTDYCQFDVRVGMGLNQNAEDFFTGTGLSFKY